MKNTVIWITIIIASVVALHTNWDNIAPQVLSAHSVMADMLNRANGDDRAIPVVQAFNHMPTKQEVQHRPVITPPQPPQPMTEDQLIKDIDVLLRRES